MAFLFLNDAVYGFDTNSKKKKKNSSTSGPGYFLFHVSKMQRSILLVLDGFLFDCKWKVGLAGIRLFTYLLSFCKSKMAFATQ
jgi:hypothetical protein